MLISDFKYYFKQYQGRSFDTVVMSIVFSLICILLLFAFNKGMQWLIMATCVFLLDCLWFLRIVWWKRSLGKVTEVYGFLRWDDTIEIHIANVKSNSEFQRRMRKTIKYAREHGYLIEFTSAILTYGRVTRHYGEGVVSIKTLGLFGRLFNAAIAARFNPTYNVTHPIKVVLDPLKLKRSQINSSKRNDI